MKFMYALPWQCYVNYEYYTEVDSLMVMEGHSSCFAKLKLSFRIPYCTVCTVYIYSLALESLTVQFVLSIYIV